MQSNYLESREITSNYLDALKEHAELLQELFIGHVQQALPVISGYPSLHAKVAVLETLREAVNAKLDERYIELTFKIDRIRTDILSNEVVKAMINNAIQLFAIQETQPLQAKLQSVVLDVQELKHLADFSSASRINSDLDTLWRTVASLCDDAKKGERLPRRRSRPQGSATSIAPPPLSAKELADQAVKSMMKATTVTLERGKFAVADPPAYRTSSQDLSKKRPRTEEKDNEPPSKRRLDLGGTNAPPPPPSLTLQPYQLLDP